MSNAKQQIQAELGLLCELTNDLKRLEDSLVAKHPTEQSAFRLCIAKSPVHRSQESIADSIGLSRSALNTILNGDQNKRARYMSRAHQVKLQRLCQNTAIDQWADLYGRGMLECQRSEVDRIAELEAELERLKGVRGVA